MEAVFKVNYKQDAAKVMNSFIQYKDLYIAYSRLMVKATRKHDLPGGGT